MERLFMESVNNMTNLKKNEHGFYQIQPSPSYAEVDKFYREDFYADEYKFFNDSMLKNQLNDLEYNRKLWALEHKNIQNKTGRKITSVLDIGCGWCKYLEWCAENKLDVVGLDPSPESSEYGKKLGLKIQTSNFEKLTILDKKFDLVVLKNVLEHVIEPESFLRQIVENYMEIGSVLQIEVPNEFNPLQKVAQAVHNLDEWWVAPPAHLNYFDISSLKSLGSSLALDCVIARATFPMEMFLLMGKQYIGNSELGSECHSMRKKFEENLIDQGQEILLDKIYEKLAEIGIGRQLNMFFQK